MKLAGRISVLMMSAWALCVWSSSALAHHSAAQFDFTKPVTIEGTVKEFEVMNPHTHATIAVTDAKGSREVRFEGHSASNFYRAGYVRGAVKPGEHIAILTAPRKDGQDGGFILSFRTQSGQVIGFGGLVPST